MPAQTVGQLAVQLVLDDGNLRDGVGKSVNFLKALAISAKDANASVAAAAGASASALSAAGQEATKASGIFRDASGRLRDAAGRFLTDADVLARLGNSANASAEDIALLNEQLEKIKSAAAKDAVEGMTSSLSSMSATIMDQVVTALKAFGVALAGVAAASVYTGATFQQKMQQVGVVAGATGEEFDALSARARELGATTSFSASEAADAMLLLAGAGLNTSQVLAATGDALVLAGAGGTTLEVAASALTATMSQFSLSAGEAGRISDVFAKATAGSQFTVEGLNEAMKYGGTVGAGYGWSLEQTVAALAQFRDAGLDASMAGTALRSAMVGATMASQRNIETMAKYGLTMQDISPELHSFQEILTTIGRAGMTTTDSLIVFGTEAGAVVKTLSDQMAMGSQKYDQMLASLEGATGAAAEMYSQMNLTVIGSFAELQSAAEEMLLTLFDTYKGPLAELLDATANLVNKVVVEVQKASGAIAGSMETALGAITFWINENADFIAQSIAGFIQGAAELVAKVRLLLPYLQQMLPLLDDIALAMGLVWVAMQVAQFVSAVQSAIGVLSAMQFSVGALMTEITVATGGIYALVAAVGILVVGMGALISRYNEAEEAARNLKDAQDALTAKQVTADQTRAAYLEGLLRVQREEAQAQLQQEAAAGQLTRARRQELELLTELTGATAQQMEAAGKLVLVNGKLRSAVSIAEEMDPEVVSAFNARVKELAQESSSAERQLKALETQLQAAQQVDLGDYGASARVAVLLQQADRGVETIAQAEAKIAQLQQQIPQYGEAAQKLRADYTQATTDMLDTEGKAVAKAGRSRIQVATATADEGLKVEQEYVDRVADLHAGLAMELARIGASELQRLELDLQEREQKIREQYAAQMQDAGGNASEVARLEAQMQADLEILAAIGAAKRTELETAVAEKAAAAKAREASRVQGIISGMEEAGLAESVRLEQEKAATLAGISDQYGAEKLRIAELYDAKIAEARAKEVQETNDAAEEVKKKQVDVWGAAVKAVDGFMNGLNKAIGVLQSMGSAARGFISFFADGLESLTGFSFNLGEAMDAVVEAMGKAGEAAAEVPGEMTVGMAGAASMQGPTGGVAANAAQNYVTGLVDAAVLFVDALVAALPVLVASLVEQLPIVIDALVAALPGLVAILAASVPDLVGLFAEQMPRVIQALLDGLPVIIQGITDSFPALIDSLVALLPTLVEPLMTAVQTIMDMMIRELPRLVIAIIQLIPGIIQGILDHLPDVIAGLIAGIADIVVAIVEAIPEIVTSLVEAIPSLITSIIDSLMAAIPQIIMAVVRAIPKIIAGIIGGIPEIIGSLLAAIPTIIQMVVSLIPDLIMGIADSLPMLIPVLINLLPEIITQLLVFLPQIISALFMAFFVELPKQLPAIIASLAMSLVEALKLAFDSIAKLLSDLFKSAWEALTSIGSGGKNKDSDKGSAYSGITYVPATMRMTVHPGEMIVPANRNPQRAGDRADPAMAGMGGGGGGGGDLSLQVLMNGRVVEQVLLDSQKRGQASGLTRQMRSTAGVKAGVDRGKWSKGR